MEVSSELEGHPKNYASDEEIRTYWSAKTKDKGEWISMDLQKECSINAIQINYAENNMNLFGRKAGIYYQYLLEYSDDNKTWKTLVDKKDTVDAPHDYIEFKTPVKARYIRLTNHYMPDGTFALADLRVFGNAGGAAPAAVEALNVTRNEKDRVIAKLSWPASPGAVGYNIRFGTAPDKLYHTYQVLGTDSVSINSLNSLQKYYFAIDVFNENGVTKGNKVIEVP